MTVKLTSLSIFFPAYNDARSLPALVRKSVSVAEQVAKKYEIVVINDGSTDNTSSVLNKLSQQYSNLRVITHRKNRGYGGSIISGFKYCKYKWIFYTDGDGQYDPRDLIKLASRITSNVDVINGYKDQRSDTWTRRVVGSVYNYFLHFAYDLPIRDVDCDFRLLRQNILANISLKSQSGGICIELVIRLSKKGARFAEVPIHHHKRRFGESTFFTPKNIFTTAKENVELFKRFNRFIAWD